MNNPNTGRCQICFQIRPLDKLSFLTRDLYAGTKKYGEDTIRFCNDKAACEATAKKRIGFVQESESKEEPKFMISEPLAGGIVVLVLVGV